jgi:hypothetical protein
MVCLYPAVFECFALYRQWVPELHAGLALAGSSAAVPILAGVLFAGIRMQMSQMHWAGGFSTSRRAVPGGLRG